MKVQNLLTPSVQFSDESDFHFLSRTSKGFFMSMFPSKFESLSKDLIFIRLSICLSLTIWVLSMSIYVSESVWIVRIVRTSVHLMFESAKLWCICVNFDTLSVICINPLSLSPLWCLVILQHEPSDSFTILEWSLWR